MKETWTEVISPKRSMLDLNLKEVWRYRDLIMLFVRRDFVSQYKQTILGPLWFFIGPIFTVFSFTFVFSEIGNIPTDGVPGPLFYLAGTTLWNYFQSCFNGTATTFVSNAAIFGKVYFPRLVAPISVVISNLFKFFLQMLMFMVFWGYYYANGKTTMNEYVLLFPVLVILMAAIGLGMGIIFSSLTTKYRDLNFFIGFGVTLLMYMTPIIYPVSAIPEMYKQYLFINPITPVIEAFRYGFTGSGTLSWMGLAYSSIFAIVTMLLGTIIFNQTEKTFMDTV
jgi:lipopolysaccharide transport system permease protein